jgi:multisubunit Na+/H+ antiporter MnhF subunit
MQGRPYPELFWLAAPLGFLATMFVLANITGLSPISVYSTFLLSVLFLVGFVSTIFVAQFRIERTTSDP